MGQLPAKQLGGFELVRELGRGGMGIVYEARQVSLNRKVALKVLSPGLALSDRAVDRFHREAEAAAKLHHTNIVPVYTTGEENGTHFYAMELIDGAGLDVVIRQLRGQPGPPCDSAAATVMAADLVVTGAYAAPDPIVTTSGVSSNVSSTGDRFNRIAAMIADVAEALHHAHVNGVTHRDVKPSNLLLSSNGRLSITDFGLARMLEQPGMTVPGEFVGTPAYMSPEQITAGRVPVDHRTDVYSLGATLYELLTLRPPFAADGRDKLLAMVIQKEPPPPRSIAPKVPRDLETICLKCLEKDPDRRYQSAKELADDLRRFVNRFAILARRAGPLTRAKKWVRRHPGVSVLGCCLLVAVLAAGFFAHQAKQDRDRLRAEQRQAAVDKAVLEAMTGDARAALEAIAEAERKGAEPGQLNLLRGVIEVNRGRPKEALVYLEQSDEQLPDSVAVKAMLVKAYLDDGQWPRADEMYALLEQLEPRTPEDHLFLGLSTDLDPVRALRLLEAAPARTRQSPVYRLARAVAQTALAQMTDRVEDAEQALDDLRRVDLPDTPWLLNNRLRACLVAAHAYGPNDPRQEGAWKQAAREVERLARYRDHSTAIGARCNYYFVRGDDESLLNEVRQARQKGIDDQSTDFATSVLYARKRFDEALRVQQTSLAGGSGAYQLIWQGVVLAAMPGRKVEAEKAISDGIRACKGGSGLAFVTGYLQLLGPEYRAKSVQAALDVRARSSHLIPKARHLWYHDLLAFHAGLMDAKELIEKAGESRYNQCEAHFYIGLRKLAEGKRAEVKACFARSYETGVYFYWEYLWSRAFLARIDDPEWLPWLSEKK